ncbi:hypothetical protein SDC9_40070 [bioreactor metagenome]|uniref:DUF2520 domain-containing protein n=1 Tax=bioreactor metagenome TaxID=1076179 RepID=A0A644VTV1_9ZZZZ|nr:DUF2520 domain-containing protein [Paludibacter sp.]
MKIVFIGAGNLATHLSLALQQMGEQIVQVYSRTKTSASELAALLSVPYTTSTDKIIADADVYFYTVSDDALESLVQLPFATNAIHVHTAGSVSMDIFQGKKKNFGVFYPLQTFSKAKQVNFNKIPLFIEASSPEVETELFRLAHVVSEQVYRTNSEQRLKLHVSAVFACNFVNHMYQIAFEMVKSADLPFEVLKPLILETAEKVMHLSPEQAQTGPAKRNDQGVINKHLEVLVELPALKQLYQDLSDMILNQYLHQS